MEEKKVLINTNEIENAWEKNEICFIKMKGGKVWLCNPKIKIVNDVYYMEEDGTEINYVEQKTLDYILSKKGIVQIPLLVKEK